MLGGVEEELGNLECSGLPQSPPAPRAIGTSGFASAFGERVLPVLGLFRSSYLVARGLPDSWLTAVDSGMIEHALSRDDRESAALLVRRRMERPLFLYETWSERIGWFRDGWEGAPGSGQPPQYGPATMGWLSRVHGLAGPATFREPGLESIGS
jgi:hypothetical protein